MEENLLKIIEHYGLWEQLKYIQTEYYELTEAIFDKEYDEYSYFGGEDRYKNHVAEEIADIMVMLKQLQYHYEITDKEVEKVMKYKIKRQLERIENEQEQLQ